MLSFENLVESRVEQLKFIVCQTLLWMILYKFVQEKVKLPKGMKKKDADDTINRIISIIHGMFTFIYATIHLFGETQPTLGMYNTGSQVFLISASTAYFIYDLIACQKQGLANMDLYLHHSLAITGYTSGIIGKYGATDCIWGIFYAEISNFPMHARMIVKTFGLRYTRMYESLEILYLVVYTIARGIFIPIYLAYPCAMNETTPFFVKFICVGMYIQSVIFIKTMISMMKNKKKQKRERRKKGIHYHWFSLNPQVQQLEYVQKSQQKERIF